MAEDTRADAPAAKAAVDLSRDTFMRDLIRELAGTLEDVIGLDDASGYISVVGQVIGEKVDTDYKNALAIDKLDRKQVGDVLVDMKRRINGKFFIIEEDEDRIVFGNHRCPFGDKVIGRPSMCMMTSNVFGHIAAENLGYSKVVLEETIAEGHSGCRVVLHLRDTAEARAAEGREYVAA